MGMLEGFIEPGIPVPMFWVMVGSAIIILGISKSGVSGGAILSLPLMMMVMPLRSPRTQRLLLNTVV